MNSSTKSTPPELADLLLRWEELSESGQPVSAEQLCRDRPELIEPLRRRIAMLQAVDGVFGSSATTLGLDGQAPSSQPQVPGYEILDELGRGGMGVVYKARQIKLNRTVALKIILSGNHAGPSARDRFRAEAEAVARLQHPSIVQIYDVGEDAGCPYLALEFVDGGSLADRIDGTPWQPSAAASLMMALVRTLDAVHKSGIVHRDLKPANILMMRDGTPKISDFGVAKLLDRGGGPTQTGDIIGTPSYMAPEQAGGKRGAIGPATDVYALGVILYELLTGRPPFRAANTMDTILQVISDEPLPPSRLQPRMPRDLETVCLKCLAKEPAARYADAAALAEDLGRFLEGKPTIARPVGLVTRTLRWARRNPALAALVAVSAAAAAALLLVGYFYNARLREEHDLAVQAADKERDAKTLAEHSAEEARLALAKSRERLTLNYVAYGRVCALVSRMATASDRHQIEQEQDELRRLAEWIALAGDESVKPALNECQTALKAWTEGAPPPVLKTLSLALADACRQSWLDSVEHELPLVAREIRTRLYDRACRVGDQLAAARSFQEAESVRREFWELYYGELAIVEAREVKQAMIAFGDEVRDWHEGPAPAEFRELARQLRQTCDPTKLPIGRTMPGR